MVTERRTRKKKLVSYLHMSVFCFEHYMIIVILLKKKRQT